MSFPRGKQVLKKRLFLIAGDEFSARGKSVFLCKRFLETKLTTKDTIR